jgi:hypothetical protein
MIDLLTRYRDEWMAIASEYGKKGHHWASLLALPKLPKEGATHGIA